MAKTTKPATDNRENILRIRLTKEERKLLDDAAGTRTLETSTWARSELLALAKELLAPRRGR